VKQKGFTEIVVVVVIVLVIVGVMVTYFLLQNNKTNKELNTKRMYKQTAQPTLIPVSTSQPPAYTEINCEGLDDVVWKTYINKAYDYSIRYPSSWFINETGIEGENEPIKPNEFVLISAYKVDFIGAGGTGPRFPNALHISSDNEWNKRKLDSLEYLKTNPDKYRIKDVSLNNIDAKEVVQLYEDIGGEDSPEHISYYISDDNQVYDIYYLTDESQSQCLEILKQSASTFSLTR
jgi:hypothetical protein